RVPGYLHSVPRGKSDAAASGANHDRASFGEEAALASEMGFHAELVDEGPFIGGPGVAFANQARFHPRVYLAAMARAIDARGGHIFEHSETQEFCDKPRGVKANGCTLTCDHVVLATHTPLMGLTRLASATLF